MLERLREEQDTDQELISFMTKLVNRLKSENMEQGINVNQMVRFQTRKRTVRGSIAPHRDEVAHPHQKGSISDLEDLQLDDE